MTETSAIDTFKHVTSRVVLALMGWLCSVHIAWACSHFFQPEAEYQYDNLDAGKIETGRLSKWEQDFLEPTALIEQSELIFLATPKEAPYIENSKSSAEEDDARNYISIYFEPTSFLKGQTTDNPIFKDFNSVPVPVLSKQEIASDHKTPGSMSYAFTGHMSQKDSYKEFLDSIDVVLDRRNSFSYWDALDVEDTFMHDMKNGTSCGPNALFAFDFDRPYLVMTDKNGATLLAEPVSGLDDPLVVSVKSSLTSETGFYKTIKLTKFFENMSTLGVVEIDHCDAELLDKNASTTDWNPYFDTLTGMNSVYSEQEKRPLSFRHTKDFAVSKTRAVDLDKLEQHYAGLFEYFDNNKSMVTCTEGEQFLVYNDNKAGPVFGTLWFMSDIPPFRFARVVEGEIAKADIRTNYRLEGPDYISVTEILSHDR